MSAIDDLFTQRARGDGGATHRDIMEHLLTLRSLASMCETVVEFGVRTGNSTVAFLASECCSVISYDARDPEFTPPPDAAAKWTFIQADTAKLADIPSCDLLFIDTLHTYEQVKAELRHANRVRDYIVFHDTVNYGGRDENGSGPGIISAILEFMADNPSWRVRAHHKNNNGLTVLRRA